MLLPSAQDPRLLVTTSLTDLAVTDWQWRAEVVQHQTAQLITRTLFAHVIAAQLPELLQLLVRQLDRRLEHDPDHRLQERWSGQRAQISPVGLGVGQQAAGVKSGGNGDAVVLVRNELQEFNNLIEALVVLSALERNKKRKC